ncbi:hypothetical protein [Vulcanisaeta sp. JCM 16161]|uniref:hypothetical protein n=1 Tax=Vulcanisaeta sp. JCM 16161 TaxID=1295372 RepID=UPI001FB3CA1D|nr:hypothetical protein [Vulcanisaeta sp. JCM 16161]
MRHCDKNLDSLYYISMSTGMSIATAYRKALDLMNLGLIERVSKGHYVITTKGVLLLALMYIGNGISVNRDAFELAIDKLREDWDLEEFDRNEIINYLKLLYKGISKLGLSPLSINIGSLGKSVYYILPENISNGRISLIHSIAEYLGVSENEVRSAERVIAKALLDYLPSVRLKDGCRAVVTLTGDQSIKASPTILAIKCRIKGYSLNSDCPVALSLIRRAFNE